MLRIGKLEIRNPKHETKPNDPKCKSETDALARPFGALSLGDLGCVSNSPARCGIPSGTRDDIRVSCFPRSCLSCTSLFTPLRVTPFEVRRSMFDVGRCFPACPQYLYRFFGSGIDGRAKRRYNTGNSTGMVQARTQPCSISRALRTRSRTYGSSYLEMSSAPS